MCHPSHYGIEYEINPWMKGSVVDQQKAIRQWQTLVAIYESLGIKVTVIEQKAGLPDMVFAADQGIVFGNSEVLLSNFRYVQRRGESKVYSKWYKDHGYKVRLLPKDMYFEGNGELQKWRDMLFIGTGFRSSYEASLKVGKILGKKVLPIELIDDRFYHLDTCLFVLNNEVVLYYPKALSQDSVSNLQKLVPNLVEIEESDALKFATNSVVIDSNLIIQTGNTRIGGMVKKLGYNVIDVDVSEFVKAGGGIHCLTGMLYN